MALNFPSSPSDGQLHTENSISYRYNSSVGAWLIVPASIPSLSGSLDQQVIFNNQGFSNGSNGLTFSTTANTLYTHNVAVTANVSATYFLGNGALLTGVVSDFSPAFDKANAANVLACTAFDSANTKLSNTSGVIFDGTLNIKTDLNIGNNITSVNSVIFNTAAGITSAAEGQITWNANESTFDLGMANGSILQVGQEIFYRVKNQTGSTIPEGTVVMAAGTLGASGRIKVTPAISDGTYPSKYLMGIATGNIADGADGYVTAFGKVRGIDTSMWSEGDILYANVSVAGALQNTMPTAPNTKTTVAIVVNKHATTGTLFVRPTYGSKLNEDELVELTSLSNGDLIRYDTANGRFENINENSTGPAINAAAAFDKANSANVFVKAAFDKANTGGGNTFAVISVPGKSNVEATITGDAVTLASNGGINIETNQTNKTVYLTLADTIDYGLVDGSVTATNDYGSV